MCTLCQTAGDGDIFVQRQPVGVEHDRGKAQFQRQADLGLRAVILVQGDRYIHALGGGFAHGGHHTQPAFRTALSGIQQGAVADLDDSRGSFSLRRPGDGLGLFPYLPH